ncbi:flagellar L-ring protein [Sphingobium jiangsuense]|uniref:Flagellar L-ring protein n=1 Tax=Sphingobium jiangsuense TaxID=870476 RepID=A0A7W6BDK4_9SPHN|nr:flagellar basal body L-ring protein FlgH [Sphingobium jiangsuense]MBB3924950.1 flagellar L-ring protein precursor FlgH [Sphingobium jiangsuense]GLT00219.1 flagellar L-ring protein [Sphingobium jiangsuense]
MKRAPLLLLATAALIVAAPADAKKKKEADEAFAPTYSMPMPEAAPANGSIFQAAYGYAPLTSGARAAMIGDIITILLVESTQASKSTAANTSRTGDIGLNPPSTGLLSKLFSASDIGASGSNSFKGTGAASQSNSLSGEITVTVARVFPNGTLLVKGEKALTLNRGDEYIQISGLVRQADITPDNRVLSTRVADAKITYTGKGEIARASRQGWLQRFFSMISPF